MIPPFKILNFKDVVIIRITYRQYLYSSLIKYRSPIKEINFQNKDEKEWDIMLKISASNLFSFKMNEAIRLKPNDSYILDTEAIRESLDVNDSQLLNLVKDKINLEITINGNRISTPLISLDQLPINEWPPTDDPDDQVLLSTFINEYHPAVKNLISGIQFHASEKPEDFLQRILEYLTKQNIEFKDPGLHPGVAQPIRFAEEIIPENRPGSANCLDLCLITAACLLYCNYSPLIAIIQRPEVDHALIGCLRNDVNTSPLINTERLIEYNENIIWVDALRMVIEHCSFKTALVDNAFIAKRIKFCLDVKQARILGDYPIIKFQPTKCQFIKNILDPLEKTADSGGILLSPALVLYHLISSQGVTEAFFEAVNMNCINNIKSAFTKQQKQMKSGTSFEPRHSRSRHWDQLWNYAMESAILGKANEIREEHLLLSLLHCGSEGINSIIVCADMNINLLQHMYDKYLEEKQITDVIKPNVEKSVV